VKHSCGGFIWCGKVDLRTARPRTVSDIKSAGNFCSVKIINIFGAKEEFTLNAMCACGSPLFEIQRHIIHTIFPKISPTSEPFHHLLNFDWNTPQQNRWIFFISQYINLKKACTAANDEKVPQPCTSCYSAEIWYTAVDTPYTNLETECSRSPPLPLPCGGK